jgi:hypothetical protein
MSTIRTCPFMLGRHRVEIYGGPYRCRPKHMFGINMAAEIDDPSDVHIMTQDFSVPDEKELLQGLRKGLLALGMKRQVYVGCMGGIGRTGLYLAAMAKATGARNPVSFVRAHYLLHAVETTEQQEFIRDLDVSSLKLTALQARITRTLLFWR